MYSLGRLSISIVFGTASLAGLTYAAFLPISSRNGAADVLTGTMDAHALRDDTIGLFVLVATIALALCSIAPPRFVRAAGSPLRALVPVAAAAGVLSAGMVALFLDATGTAPGSEPGREVLSNAAVALAVSLLLTFELLLALAVRPPRAQRPKAAAAAGTDLSGIRITLFLFMMAEELSRSFLPLYARDLDTPFPGLSETLAMGLPIGLFMLLVTLFTPFAGAWVDRFGSRRTLLFAALPAVAGFVGTAAAQTLVDLLLWRSACALGYAVTFIGAQGFIASHTGPRDRAWGMAQFVAAVVVAGLCGAPVGGILADQFGSRATFLVSAGLALAAAGTAAVFLPAEPPERARRRDVGLRDYAMLLANPRFAALLAFSSVPTKLMLTGYFFYLVPVYLHGLGETPAAIGRTMMGYGLLVVLLGPWVSRSADRTGRHALFAGLGGLIGGVGTLAVLREPGVAAVLAGVAALGIAHAFNNATQLALVPELCRTECARIGRTSVFAIYRLLERGGSVLGPLLAAALADRFGPRAAMAALGTLGLTSALAFCAVFVLAPNPDPAPGTGAAGEEMP